MTDSITNWRVVDGDNTLALDWSLDENSLVWEIGGYEGRWAAQMVEKFNPEIHIFEPQDWAFEKLSARFWDNEKVYIYPWGLWVENANMPLHHFETDGASLLNHGGKTQMCEFKDIWDVLDIWKVLKEETKDIDVCLMNIEGAEFALIAYLLGADLMKRFRFFWCQFHTFADPSGDNAQKIYDGIQKTHNLIWDYYPTAVAWERKTLTLPSPTGRGESQ